MNTLGKRGAITVAIGHNAAREAENMIASFKRFHDLPVMVVGDREVKGADYFLDVLGESWGARHSKFMAYTSSPWAQVLWLDADTEVQEHLGCGFEILNDGWDLVITPSRNQETRWLWQADSNEYAYTNSTIGRMLSLQGGVWWASKSMGAQIFFGAWHSEWERFQHIDQGALIRALQLAPLKVWLLGTDFNDGQVVKHNFGRARG